MTCCGCDCCLGSASDYCTCWVCGCNSHEDGFGDDDRDEDDEDLDDEDFRDGESRALEWK